MSVVPFGKPEVSVPATCPSVDFYKSNLKVEPLDRFGASYLDCGKGPILVFLHGNFCTSFCWRKQVAELAENFRCIAPDLLGLGQSARLADNGLEHYDFQAQREFVSEFFNNVIQDSEVVLVVQGSGATFGCDWAYRNQGRVKGIIHLSGVFPNALDDNRESQSCFSMLKELSSLLEKEPERIADVINMVVSSPLSGEVLNGYTRPFDNARAMAIAHYWMKSLADRDFDPEIYAQTICNTSWITKTDIPKLMIDSKNTLPAIHQFRDMARSFNNQMVTEYDGAYLVQEESPEWLVEKLADWISGLESLVDDSIFSPRHSTEK